VHKKASQRPENCAAQPGGYFPGEFGRKFFSAAVYALKFFSPFWHATCNIFPISANTVNY